MRDSLVILEIREYSIVEVTGQIRKLTLLTSIWSSLYAALHSQTSEMAKIMGKAWFSILIWSIAVQLNLS